MQILLNDENRVIGFCGDVDMGGIEITTPPPSQNILDYKYIDGTYVYDPVIVEQINEPTTEQRLAELQSANEELRQTNEALLECLLQISEILYA